MMSKFIVFEGIDGSGKSSVGKYLEETFDGLIFTKEPSDSDAGKLAQKAANQEHSPYLDLFLYLADRVEHTEKIKRWMSEDNDVLCDRYWGSTAAYQAAAEDIDLSYIEYIQETFIHEPDLTILFDVDPEVSIERIEGRDIKSKYEKIDYLQKVRENYQTLAERHDWVTIDASEPLEDVKDKVYSLVKMEMEK
ncbi:MAG: dTMP kinase [Thermoplasmatota archaeon]